MDTDNQVLAKWNEIKEVMSSIELDVAKNARGTAAAGVRARKGLRTLKIKATELVKLTVELDKVKKTEKSAKASKAPGKAPKKS
jgi:hypothetical protein